MSRKKIASIILLLLVNITFSQVGIGTSNPNNSAALEIVSTNSGLLIPRIALTSTTDVATIASPATSLLVYNTTTLLDVTPGFYYFDGIWKPMGSAKSGWNLTGNAIPLIENEFLGTTNSRSLIFKVKNEQFAKFHPNGGISLGKQASSAGQNATAIGFEAKATQSNSIILGSSANSENKIGIGTDTPTERLHVAGSVRIVDGTQAAGSVLTSDANGKGSWKDVNANKAYAEIYNTANLSVPLGAISFDVIGENANMSSVSNTGIQIKTTGIYKVSYTMTLFKGSGGSAAIQFSLSNGTTEIPGTRVIQTIGNSEFENISISKLINLTASQLISVQSPIANPNFVIMGNTANLIVKLIK